LVSQRLGQWTFLLHVLLLDLRLQPVHRIDLVPKVAGVVGAIVDVLHRWVELAFLPKPVLTFGVAVGEVGAVERALVGRERQRLGVIHLFEHVGSPRHLVLVVCGDVGTCKVGVAGPNFHEVVGHLGLRQQLVQVGNLVV